MVAVQNSVRDLGSPELWEASRARSTRRRESYRRRRQVRRMSVPLVMAATAAGMGAPAYAAGKEHQASAKAGARRVLPRILRVGDTGPDVVKLQRRQSDLCARGQSLGNANDRPGERLLRSG